MESNDKIFKADELLSSPNEIDLNLVYAALQRNKKQISIYGLIGLLISGILAISTKRTWQGGFQIVVEENNKSAELSISPTIARFTGINSGANQLQTEVEILKSPSVLMNIFEYVKSKKNPEGDTNYSTRFTDWRSKNLSVKLKSGTKVLNIKYKDADKNIILPVLKKISNTYQKFSNEKRLRNLELANKYFKNQIEKYTEKNIKSATKAEEYGRRYDLAIEKEGLDNSVNVDSIRLKSANKFRIASEKLKKIQEIDSNSEEIKYLALQTPSIANSQILQQIKAKDLELNYLSGIFKKNDTSIQEIIKTKKELNILLKSQLIGLLEAESEDAKLRMKASKRPEGVVLNYKKLINESKKDRETLNQLEVKYRAISLELARAQDPWKLITKPTLLPYPIAPQRKKMVFLGLVFGLIVGSFISLIKEKKKGIVYSLSEMKYLTLLPILSELPFNNQQVLKENINLFFSNKNFINEGDIGIFIIGSIEKEETKKLKAYFEELLTNQKLIISSELLKLQECSTLIVLTELGTTTQKEIDQANKKINLRVNKPKGLLVLT